MIDQPAMPPACAIIVEAKETKDPHCMLGLIVEGTQPELEKLEAAAKAEGLKGSVFDDAGVPNFMTLYLPGIDTKKAWSLYNRINRGDFGRLKLEVMVTPVSKAWDGIDPGSEIKVVTPAYFVAK